MPSDIYLWRIRLPSYGADGYDAEWVTADPGEAELYEQEGRYQVTILGFEVPVAYEVGS